MNKQDMKNEMRSTMRMVEQRYWRIRRLYGRDFAELFMSPMMEAVNQFGEDWTTRMIEEERGEE